MTDTKIKLGEYVTLDSDLTGFRIVEMTEVYQMDVEGRSETGVVGFFKDPNIADAFAKIEGGYMMRTRPALVLTSGAVGFVIRDQEAVKFFYEEEEALRLKQKVLNKLSVEERKLLGL